MVRNLARSRRPVWLPAAAGARDHPDGGLLLLGAGETLVLEATDDGDPPLDPGGAAPATTATAPAGIRR